MFTCNNNKQRVNEIIRAKDGISLSVTLCQKLLTFSVVVFKNNINFELSSYLFHAYATARVSTSSVASRSISMADKQGRTEGLMSKLRINMPLCQYAMKLFLLIKIVNFTLHTYKKAPVCREDSASAGIINTYIPTTIVPPKWVMNQFTLNARASDLI
uniref:Uncharacterized protein n=1 Tax=Glossina austeni TaxID=7395 RepID=A0A1A9V605_GLOAU